MKKLIDGVNLRLRDVTLADCAFILELRTDTEKSRFLHQTKNDINQQMAYIERYKTLPDEWYFIIENKSGERFGTIRIYDITKDSFCIGSWILKDGIPVSAAIESFLLINIYGFLKLNFPMSHFDVRKDNRKVWKFHQQFGGVRSGETDLDYLYTRSRGDFCRIALMFGDLIPEQDQKEMRQYVELNQI